MSSPLDDVEIGNKNKQIENSKVMKTTYNTLTEAVIAAINLIKNLSPISAYQVTTLIREKCNADEWEVIGCEARPNNNNIKFWINHDDVRRAINELYANNELDALGFTGRQYNDKYFEYSFDTTQNQPDPNAPTVTVPVNPSVPVVQFNQPFLENRIKTYVNNQPGKVTMKQIQSALKIKGVTCEDICGILDKMDYSISEGPNGPGYFSQYVVL